jgi:hypothetical protein
MTVGVQFAARRMAAGRALSLGLAAAALCGCAGGSAARGHALAPYVLATDASAKPEPWVSDELGVALDKPAGDGWAAATDVVSPDGNAIPLVVAHGASGAQIVVQVSEPVDTPERLAAMLRARLSGEQALELGETRPVKVDSGSEAYGFPFHVEGEANGRVAIIQAGEHVVLIVASWPEDASRRVVDDVDGLVRSVRRSPTAQPATLRPDKA